MAVGILRPDEVIFYHPLDNFVEQTVGQTWTGGAGFVAGKVGSSASAVTADAFSTGPVSTLGVGTSQHDLAGLSATNILAAYVKSGSYFLAVGTVSGTNITWGTELAIGTTSQIAISIAAMSPTMAVVISSQAGSITAHVATVTGTTVTVGAPTTFDGAQPRGFDISKLDATHAVAVGVSFDGGAENGRGTVLTVTGTTIAAGTPALFDSGVSIAGSVSQGGVAVAALTSTSIIVAWHRQSDNIDRLAIGTVSGTAIVYSASTVFTTSAVNIRPRVTALTSTTALVMSRFTSFSFSARVVTVAGTAVTLGPETVVQTNAHGSLSNLSLNSTSVVAVFTLGGVPNVKKITVSGTTITPGAATAYSTTSAPDITVAPLTSASVVMLNDDGTNGIGAVGVLSQSSTMTAPTPAAYPTAVGHDRVVMAMWAKNITGGSSLVTVQRGYIATLSATEITLGGTTATWSGGGIGALMSAMNDGFSHLLVLDFVNTGGTNWTLSTSVDGAAFTPQGAQTSGTQVVITTDTAPGVSIASGVSSQWIDELVMWCGSKTAFDIFTTQELANLNDLANVFGEPMNQFQSNFGAPLCWQATAKMPDGSVWRDSGSGPCPPVVRVPRGAGDIVITDDGAPASPHIIEG